MKRKPQPRAILLGGVLGILLLLAGMAWAWWDYAMYVPPLNLPANPPPPNPNGRDIVLWVLGSQILPSDLTQVRMDALRGGREQAATEASRRRLQRPLAEIRAALHYRWAAAPARMDSDSEGRLVPSCAYALAAESRWYEEHGDAGTALDRALDAMELGARLAEGGDLNDRQYGWECHKAGLERAEGLALHAPAPAAARALSRIRRLRSEWPSLAEALEAHRLKMLLLAHNVSELFLRDGVRLALDSKWRGRPDDRWTLFQAIATPKRWSVAATDAFYRRVVEEGRKPVRARAPQAPPNTPWFRGLNLGTEINLPSLSSRQAVVDTEISLLETALAARLHFLRHARYPGSLAQLRPLLLTASKDGWDQPIIYRLQNGRPLIYSLGPDAKDDGGAAVDPRDIGQPLSPMPPVVTGDVVFGELCGRRGGKARRGRKR